MVKARDASCSRRFSIGDYVFVRVRENEFRKLSAGSPAYIAKGRVKEMLATCALVDVVGMPIAVFSFYTAP